MCSVGELVRTLRALDAGRETAAIGACVADVYSAQQEWREYLAHHPVRRRENRGGVWVSMFGMGLCETPLFMPLGVPFKVCESSATEPVVEMVEYTLTYVSEYEVPEWVHDSVDLGTTFERWFVGKPPVGSATLGPKELARNALARGMQQDGNPLTHKDFVCTMLRKPLAAKMRVNGVVQDVAVVGKTQYVWCDLKQNDHYGMFEEGSWNSPFVMRRWMKVDHRGGPWEKYPLMLPPGHHVLAESVPAR